MSWLRDAVRVGAQPVCSVAAGFSGLRSGIDHPSHGAPFPLLRLVLRSADLRRTVRLWRHRGSGTPYDPPRLSCSLHWFVLGGRPGERLTERLSIPVSADTLLRTLRRRSAPTPASTKIVGLDDFAWRRGHRYGTIVCDLEQRRIIDLLADREIGTVTAWLRDHPAIEIVCRDRGGGYREAATHGAPQAVQITDRWLRISRIVGSNFTPWWAAISRDHGQCET